MYLALCKALLKNETYHASHDQIDYKWLKENQPETFQLFQCVRYLHEQQGNVAKDYSTHDLELTFRTLYPQAQLANFEPLFAELRSIEVDQASVQTYVQGLRDRAQATALAKLALRVAEGFSTKEELDGFIAQLPQEASAEGDESDFAEDDIRTIHEKRLLVPGLRWRLQSLNKALGSIRKGNFGFLFARPETGKTTFLASEITSMALQAASPIVWFNNEEEHEAVVTRLYQALFNVDLATLYSRLEYYSAQYKNQIQGRIRVVTDTPTTRVLVERLCKKYSPSLIIFDQIDKIEGFASDRDDLELAAIYAWAREIAKQYAPVIGVCQAGASGEGKRWLTMNDVNNSKTGKQGEADWILGIGKAADDGLESYRYLHLSKNKLQGDPDSDPALRHGKWEVKIHPDTARYSDVVESTTITNSRKEHY